MPPQPPVLGNQYINNCLVSAGYTWCEILNKCLRVWEEMCEYPQNCLTWNDGCNLCQLIDGELGACTERYCFTMGMPSCEVYAPQIAIDPLPPIKNPFLGDGHIVNHR